MAIPIVTPEGGVNPALYNPDGTIKPRSPRNYTKGKTYKHAWQAALAAQDFLPSLINTTNSAQISAAPKLAQSQLDIYKTLGPQYAAAEAGVNKVGQEAQAATDSGLLSGVGRDITSKTLDLQKLADPEFFNLRAILGDSAGRLIEGQDPNKLTEAEIANVERNQNRSNVGRGLENSGSPTAAIKNALGFDDRLQGKRNNLLAALTSIGNMAPNLKSGAFNYGAATGGAGGMAGSGAGQAIGSVFNTAGQNANQFAGNTANNAQQFGAQTSLQHQIGGQNQIPGWERVMGALPDYS